jgi:hypothetical protein
LQGTPSADPIDYRAGPIDLGPNCYEGQYPTFLLCEHGRGLRLVFEVTIGFRARHQYGKVAPHRQTKNKEADPSDWPQKDEKGYVTEEQVRHVRNQRPTSSDLLRKYEYQYQQRVRRETGEEEYERRTEKRLKKHEDTRDHWHCLFFRYCWDSSMSRLPTTRDCPECGPVKPDEKGVSVFVTP